MSTKQWWIRDGFIGKWWCGWQPTRNTGKRSKAGKFQLNKWIEWEQIQNYLYFNEYRKMMLWLWMICHRLSWIWMLHCTAWILSTCHWRNHLHRQAIIRYTRTVHVCVFFLLKGKWNNFTFIFISFQMVGTAPLKTPKPQAVDKTGTHHPQMGAPEAAKHGALAQRISGISNVVHLTHLFEFIKTD